MIINRKLLEEFAAAAVLTTSDIEVFNIGRTIIEGRNTKYFDIIEELNEAFNALGTKTSVLPPEELEKILSTAVEWQNTPRKKKDAIEKAGDPDKVKPDKYGILVHGSQARKAMITLPAGDPSEDDDSEAGTFDLKKFADLIKVRPTKLLSQNAKMKKSNKDNEDKVFFNTSIPALMGLTVDEDTGEFHVVTTCAKAGTCKIDCYARAHGYLMFPNVTIKQHRMLNYIFNDAEGYESEMIKEITKRANQFAKKQFKIQDPDTGEIVMGHKTVQIRWNDAGDILSNQYLGLVKRIIAATPTVEHYIYSKEVAMHKIDKTKPTNLTTRYSFGGKQDSVINPKKDLHAQIVDADSESRFADLKEIKGNGYITQPLGKGWQYEDVDAVKKIIANHYDIDAKDIFTVAEISKKPVKKLEDNEVAPYNVIILPGESDKPATRKDVLGIYLIKH